MGVAGDIAWLVKGCMCKIAQVSVTLHVKGGVSSNLSGPVSKLTGE